MKRTAIYEIANTVTDMTYIGSTADVRERFNRHRLHLRRGIHRNSYLQRSWNKHGENSFEFSIIESITDPSRLIEREQWHAEQAKRSGCRLFNRGRFADAPMRGQKHSPETRARISAGVRAAGYVRTDEHKEAMLAANRGRVRTLEEREKIRAALIGRPFTAERRANISRALSGKPGRKHSAETKAMMSLAKKGIPLSEAHRAALRKPHRSRVTVATQ